MASISRLKCAIAWWGWWWLGVVPISIWSGGLVSSMVKMWTGHDSIYGFVFGFIFDVSLAVWLAYHFHCKKETP